MLPPLLQVANLSKYLTLNGRQAKIVSDVSFSVGPGEVFGIAGESGCGKSTLAKLILRLIEPTSGTIIFDGIDLSKLSNKELRRVRKELQLVFQHPASSFNPKYSVQNILEEPYIIHGLYSKDERLQRVQGLLAQVGLSNELLKRAPHQLSGGQKQRVAIARALSLEPKLIVLDEPFSALDSLSQNKIIELLQKLQKEKNIALILISHDLSALRQLCDKMLVMYLGQVVEIGPANRLLQSPLHPYTRALLSAELTSDPFYEKTSSRTILRGDPPSLTAEIRGCPFFSRCESALPYCRSEAPQLKERDENHFTACHLSF